MSPELLQILVCPRTKKPLKQADTATIDQINALIKQGKCVEVSGKKINETAHEGLFQEETRAFYFVREDIPVLIYENAVLLK